ncbi:MAG: glycoside hydrolase family 5 protein [Oscillospiraceae bacterium]|nr:glycoside hydrolase family 5 protein [Oscillospiraceae bacterium]
MRQLSLAMALLILLSACAPAALPSEEPSPSPSPRIWAGRPSPNPPTPSPIPEPVGFENLPVPDVERRDIPDTEAMRFAAALSPGWNLGNTMEATAGKDARSEISWGNPVTTQEMITLLKDSGFKTLRLPVSWNNHVDGDFSIDPAWMDRVQEVVDYAYGIGMHVILNIHHDDDVRFVYPSSEHFENSALYMRRVWGQISERFMDYGDRLIFESLNEPRLKGHRNEWWQDWESECCVDSLDALCRLHQIFVDTVRASGGNNASRYLLICGLAANVDSVMHDLFWLPQDTVEDRLMVSVHAYTPYNFALNSPANSSSISDFDMTNRNRTREINNFMNRLYDKFIADGVPVVLGEFGARDRRGNLRDRAEFAAYYTAAAAARGMPAMWWDNGMFSGGNADEIFGLMDRRNARWMYPDIVDAIIAYSPIGD